MKLTVLTDNTARIDAYYLAEAGVSYYIQDGGKSILFDTGYSDVYVRSYSVMVITIIPGACATCRKISRVFGFWLILMHLNQSNIMENPSALL